MGKLLIKNADWVITMDQERRKLQHCDVLITDNVITQIGKDLDLNEEIDEEIDAMGKVVIPGLINTHHHFFQVLTRNEPELDHAPTLEQWLDKNYGIFQHVTEETLKAAAFEAMGELLKTGCTTTTDHHYVFSKRENRMLDAEIDAAKELGIRFHPTRGSISIGKNQGSYVPEKMTQTLDDILYDSERLIKTYHDSKRYSMLRIALAPCNNGLDSTEEVLTETLKLARRYQVRCHSHLAESVGETSIALERFGCRPVEFMEKMGWVGNDIWYAHCTQLNQREINLFASTGTGVAHCPVSNMQTGSICPVSDLLKAGVPVGLAVDGSGSNNSSNMMFDIRVTYLAHKLRSHSDIVIPQAWNAPEHLTAQQVLELATIGGAKVLGRDDVGSLAPGMAADLVLLDWSRFQYAGGMHDPVQCIVLTGSAPMVDTVIVNGNVRVKNGNLVDVDEIGKASWINNTCNRWLSNTLKTMGHN